LDLKVFRAISRAVYNKSKVRLAYQSMNRPEPAELVLSPHTLVFSGFRWHVRAFSDTHSEYRDFVLARVRGQPEVLEEMGVSAEGDVRWHDEVHVIVAPHPALPPAQQAIIAEDYGMLDGRCVQTLRSALVPYFLRLMQLEPGREHPDPKVQQIVLVNREELAHLMW
jgi:predicted DNA-binding transcriptional regulator YafY